MRDLVPGLIAPWSGSIVSIPFGWFLCDGTHGTPDLRDKFVIGAGSTYAPGATGGNTTHTHALTTNSHVHSIGAGATLSNAPANIDSATSFNTDSAITDAGNSLPTYYSLAYIMYGG